jgi:hypothetical protein
MEMEKECSHYIIQRRIPMRETPYRDIGQIPGSGNTSSSTTYTFTDTTVSHEGSYHYRLEVVKTDGTILSYGPIQINVKQTDNFISIYPNPIRGKAEITYTTTKNGWVTLSIYNSAGRIIRTLFNGSRSPGTYSLFWDCSNENRKTISNGLYFLRFTSPSTRRSEKIIVVD